MKIITLNESHCAPMSELFTQYYMKAREKARILPERYEDKEIVLSLLQNIYKKSHGVVAINNNELVGYLIGIPISNFKGTSRGIYCPEWAHVAIGENRAEVYRRMYESAAVNWVENGCLTHAITIMSYDNEAIDTWFRNGFGMNVVDAVRDLDFLPGDISNDIEIRKCGNGDIESVTCLLKEYKKYMASSPIYLPLINFENIYEWLENPNIDIWLGIYKGDIISIMKVIKKKSNDAQILEDDATVSIGTTYTREDFRGHGITKSILQKVIEESKLEGYRRCAVVFESQNIDGSNFWLKYFQSVCYSLIRKVDDRITWANKDRSIDTIW